MTEILRLMMGALIIAKLKPIHFVMQVDDSVMYVEIKFSNKVLILNSVMTEIYLILMDAQVLALLSRTQHA